MEHASAATHAAPAATGADVALAAPIAPPSGAPAGAPVPSAPPPARAYAIVPYSTALAPAFRAINLAWISEFFVVEAPDLEVLDDPEGAVLAPGGRIWFAVEEDGAAADGAIGTCALLPQADGSFELAKMGVVKAAQGRGVGVALGRVAMAAAAAARAPYVELLSNRRLGPALRVYEKLGFVEVPIPAATPYKRADIRMVASLGGWPADVTPPAAVSAAAAGSGGTSGADGGGGGSTRSSTGTAAPAPSAAS